MEKNELEDDIVFAKFLNYMKKALCHKKLNYYRDLQRIKKVEENIDNYTYLATENAFKENSIINILNSKERNILILHYIRGLSYAEISKITKEKISTLKQRRNRAIAKLKNTLEE